MEDFKIEPLRNDDVNIINSISDDWGDIQKVHRFYINNDFCHPTKVLINNELVGIGTAICYQNTGWLAHIIVSKNNRNLGVGSSIVKQLISYLQNDCSCSTITLNASNLGYPVYLKQGFSIQSEVCIFKTEKENVLDKISSNIKKIQKEHFQEILNMDQLISGENRFKLINPFLKTGYVYCENSEVKGFYLPDLSDGPISAVNKDAGVELLKMKMQSSKRMIFPAENNIGK